uniref:F-box domain-containing protein n=1 Tax=Tanacetum cinerariifolium TaxID=118510 RepID=A0A6L2KE82_TANCI|nr:hypothetical protein [Tanacetum cinerariifolium]
MKVQCVNPDRISSLPQDITGYILTCMPIRDAIRTSILSRKWRSGWKSMTRLAFDDKMVKVPSNCQQLKKYKLASAILNVLLLHAGSIPKIKIEVGELDVDSEPPIKFDEFSKLSTTNFGEVDITSKTLQLFLSSCPILRDLALVVLETLLEETNSHLLQCVPLIEILDIGGGMPYKLATSLVQLKSLILTVCYDEEEEVSSALCLIRSSPNLAEICLTMSADVARSHSGDGGGEDRPPPHHVPISCMGCFANRGKGKRKPNLGGRAAGRLNTRDKTRNLSLKEITDTKGLVPIQFELRDKQTVMPLGDHAAHWSSHIREVIRGVPLYYPSWLKVPKNRKAALITDIGFDLRPHMESPDWIEINVGIQQHLQKAYNTNKAAFKAQHWVIDPTTGTYNVEKIRRARPENITASEQSSTTQEYPLLIDIFFVAHTVNGEFFRDEDRRIYEEMRRLEATGTYIDDEINRLARGGKQRRYILGVGRVLPARATASPSTPAHESTLNSLHKKVDFMMSLFKSDSKYLDMFSQFESGGASGSGGCGDDEEGADDQDDEDEDGDGDT